MMGHSSGTGQDHKLDVVGGVYDHAPMVYPGVVEKEYSKLEPYLNIYSSKIQGQGLDLAENDVSMLKELLQAIGVVQRL